MFNRIINSSDDYKLKEIKVYGNKIFYLYSDVLTGSELINEMIFSIEKVK